MTEHDEGRAGPAGADAGDDEPVRPLIPPRAATLQQAVMAIGLVFFIGVAVGFALARAV